MLQSKVLKEESRQGEGTQYVSPFRSPALGIPQGTVHLRPLDFVGIGRWNNVHGASSVPKFRGSAGVHQSGICM